MTLICLILWSERWMLWIERAFLSAFIIARNDSGCNYINEKSKWVILVSFTSAESVIFSSSTVALLSGFPATLILLNLDLPDAVLLCDFLPDYLNVTAIWFRKASRRYGENWLKDMSKLYKWVIFWRIASKFLSPSLQRERTKWLINPIWLLRIGWFSMPSLYHFLSKPHS